jgi:TonB family protein
LKQRDFLSLKPLPWVLSVGTHVVFVLTMLLVGRVHPLNLYMVTLDSVSAIPSAPYVPPLEDIWQKPMLRRTANRTLPKPKPTPPPVQVSGEGGQGKGAVRSIAEVSQLPQFKTQVKAAYPEGAKRAGIEGIVILQVDIDATGAVMDVQVVQGLGSGCDEAAVEAMKQSTFTPAYAGSDPVPVRIRIPYRFKING